MLGIRNTTTCLIVICRNSPGGDHPAIGAAIKISGATILDGPGRIDIDVAIIARVLRVINNAEFHCFARLEPLSSDRHHLARLVTLTIRAEQGISRLLRIIDPRLLHARAPAYISHSWNAIGILLMIETAKLTQIHGCAPETCGEPVDCSATNARSGIHEKVKPFPGAITAEDSPLGELFQAMDHEPARMGAHSPRNASDLL